ncbi:MAG: hypothetical protein ACOCQR_02020 [bacterium]
MFKKKIILIYVCIFLFMFFPNIISAQEFGWVNNQEINILVPIRWQVFLNSKQIEKLLLEEHKLNDETTPLIFVQKPQNPYSFYFMIEEKRENTITEKDIQEIIHSIKENTKEMEGFELLEEGKALTENQEIKGKYILYRIKNLHYILACFRKNNKVISFSGTTDDTNDVPIYNYIMQNISF